MNPVEITEEIRRLELMIGVDIPEVPNGACKKSVRAGSSSPQRLGMRPNRRPEGDDDYDYVTKHHVIVNLRARVRGLARYYRRAQRDQNRVVTTVTRWARKETRAAVGAIRLLKPKAHTVGSEALEAAKETRP